MNRKPLTSLLALTCTVCHFSANAQAQLKITEVESSEAGSNLHDDWFELTNLGAAPVTTTGYKFDDNSDSISVAVALPGLTIAAGESVVFVESTTAQPMTIQGFRDWWGSSLSPLVQIGVYSGSGVGLSSTADHVNVWDGSGTLVDSVIFNTATAGSSFLFDTGGAAGRLPTGVSQSGVGGAFAAAQNGDIGSPGFMPVPEPATLALAGLGLTSLLLLRRRK